LVGEASAGPTAGAASHGRHASLLSAEMRFASSALERVVWVACGAETRPLSAAPADACGEGTQGVPALHGTARWDPRPERDEREEDGVVEVYA
jgi:hypothetical protein